jgi:hypothetical protein
MHRSSHTHAVFQQVLTFLLCVYVCVVLQVPPDMPSEYSLLMRSCWDGDTGKRPTFAQVIQCLELLLDNLTSDSDGRISEGSEGAHSTSSNSGKSGKGGNASSVTLEDLLARKSEPAAAAAAAGEAPAETACGLKDCGAASSSAAAAAAAAAADIAAGRPGGMISSSRLPAASGSGLGAGTPGASTWPEQQQELQLVRLTEQASSDRMPSAASIASSRAAIGTASLLGTGSRAGQTGGTWSSSLGRSGSLGAALGVPATPQQPAVPKQQGTWQQVGRLGSRGQQQAEPSSSSKDEADGLQLVQDL